MLNHIISIHAPSRERLLRPPLWRSFFAFQSTLPHGSDDEAVMHMQLCFIFQSTLPHGSDVARENAKLAAETISIHAPSRERRKVSFFHLILQ